jgi:hypothetical protein
MHPEYAIPCIFSEKNLNPTPSRADRCRCRPVFFFTVSSKKGGKNVNSAENDYPFCPKIDAAFLQAPGDMRA